MPAKPATMQTLQVRLELASIAQLDAVVAELSRRAGGAQVSRSEVFRLVVTRGLGLLCAEYLAKSEPGG